MAILLTVSRLILKCEPLTRNYSFIYLLIVSAGEKMNAKLIVCFACLAHSFRFSWAKSSENNVTDTGTSSLPDGVQSVANVTLTYAGENDNDSRNLNILFQPEPPQPALCLLPMKHGIRQAQLYRYHNDEKANECVKFPYGECNENDNLFLAKDKCDDACATKREPFSSRALSSTLDLCFLPMNHIIRKDHLYRYYYNATTNECVEFIYRGCVGNDNRFFTKVACEQICHRVKKMLERTMTGFKCTMEIEALDDCKLTSNLSRITSCGSVPFDSKDRKKCIESGCCWHHSYKICYNYVAKKIENAWCKILHYGRGLFFGLGTFSAVKRYPHGWIGNIHFSQPVTGDFCMVRDDRIPQKIIVGEKFKGDRGIVLQGTRSIYEGQRTSIVFIGSLGNVRFDRKICEKQPVMRKKTTK